MSSASQAADKLLDETIGQQPHGLEEVSHRGCSWNLLRKGTRDRNSLRTEEESWIRRENEGGARSVLNLALFSSYKYQDETVMKI